MTPNSDALVQSNVNVGRLQLDAVGVRIDGADAVAASEAFPRSSCGHPIIARWMALRGDCLHTDEQPAILNQTLHGYDRGR